MPPAKKSKATIPKVAFDHVDRLQKDEENRDPDAHDVDVYNDYFGYACCDLLKKEMLAIGKLTSSKTENPSLATFQRLEALTLYMSNSGAADSFHTNPMKILNLENVVRTAAKTMMQFSGIGFDNEPNEVSSAMLRVLERNGMDGTPKEKLFLGKSADSDDEEDEQEDEDSDNEEEEEEEEEEDKEREKSRRPKKKARTSGADDADVRAAAKTWKWSKAMKALKSAGRPESRTRPWDITKWPKETLAMDRALSFVGEGGFFDDDDDDMGFF
ncbi:hypothetical protein R3P38DRAFT_3336786 [Favolaschia claudopus]|uniref:Origin recognition complex subunit 6 n=1 Tax=Favolaschia claudopus TaxID=2862362 RepID=A0AAV9Z3Z2_9AGAR